MRKILTATLASALLLGCPSPARAQDDETQAVTLTLIVCPAAAADRPELEFYGPDVRQNPQIFDNYVKNATATKNVDGTWQVALRLPPAKYYLSVTTPQTQSRCSALIPFVVIVGHDRRLVAAMVRPNRIDGVGYDRSVAGVLPFPGMAVTSEQTGYPSRAQPIAVDGTTYDAESLGAAPYTLRFYLSSGDEYAGIDIDLTHTARGSYVQRNLALSDLRAGLRTAEYGPFWGAGGPKVTADYQVIGANGEAVSVVNAAFSTLVKSARLSGSAADIRNYFVNAKIQNPVPIGDSARYTVEFDPKPRYDDATHAVILESGTCQRNGMPHATFEVRADLVVTQSNLCVLNP